MQNVRVEWLTISAEELQRIDFYSRSQRSSREMEGPRLRAIENVENYRQALNDIERKLGLTQPLSVISLEWITAEKFIEEETYRRAVDTLEKLVVSRLFEFTKLSHSGTGVYFVLVSLTFLIVLWMIKRCQASNTYREGPQGPFSSYQECRQCLQFCSVKPKAASCYPRH